MNPMHRRQRQLALVGAVLALLVAGPGAGPRLVSQSGEVEIGRGEPPAWQPARAGDPLAPGDVVRTGHDGRAELQLGRGTVRLYGNSLLRLPQEDMGPAGAGAVELERGHTLFDVLRRDAVEPFEVRAREVVVSVKGTRFSVGVGDVVEVSVYRGLVGVSAPEAAHETLVREGFAAIGGAERPFELFLHGAGDPWAAWGPDALPQRSDERALRSAPPARLAVDAAERAARRSYQPDVLGMAVQRRPEVAKRVAELAERQRSAVQPEDSRLAPSDPLLDGSGDVMREAIEVPTLEVWLAAQDPSTDGLAFDIRVLDGSGVSGGDQVVIQCQDGTSWSFDGSELDAILDGQSSLPPTLETQLQKEGVSDLDAFVVKLAQLLDGR